MNPFIIYTLILVLAVSFAVRDAAASFEHTRNESDSLGYQPRYIARSDPAHRILSDIRKLAENWERKPNEALDEIDALIHRHTESNEMKPLGELYWQKTYALLRVNRNIEALIEAKKSERICGQLSDCNRWAITNLIEDIKYQMKMVGDHAVLGVGLNAELSEIKKAYRRLVFLLHPDKNPNVDPETMQFMKNLFVMVSESYQALVERRRQL